MKAITYEKYGSPDVLRVTNVDNPTPGDDEVLIRVRAAEATKSDCELRSFKFSVKWFWLPLRIAVGVIRPRRKILGGYFAGEVSSTGKNVTQFAVGEQVFGTAGLRMGAYGEYVALPSTFTIVAKPRNMTFAEAAAVPLGGLNALHFMRLAKNQDGRRSPHQWRRWQHWRARRANRQGPGRRGHGGRQGDERANVAPLGR